MTAKVPMRETGAATAGMDVALLLRKKRKTTKMTRIMESTRLSSTSASEERMVMDLSMVTSMVTASVTHWRMPGTMAFMRSTVSMMLAPWALKIMSRTAGLLLKMAMERTSCGPPCMVATSFRRTTPLSEDFRMSSP